MDVSKAKQLTSDNIVQSSDISQFDCHHCSLNNCPICHLIDEFAPSLRTPILTQYEFQTEQIQQGDDSITAVTYAEVARPKPSQELPTTIQQNRDNLEAISKRIRDLRKENCRNVCRKANSRTQKRYANSRQALQAIQAIQPLPKIQQSNSSARNE